MSAEKYKVGDKVVVKSLEWYNDNKDCDGVVRVPCSFVREMSEYCGRVFTIRRVNLNSYYLEEVDYTWSDEMFEGLAEEMYAYLKTKDVKDLPKDFAECAKVVGVTEEALVGRYTDVLVVGLAKLRICRDAYWIMANHWKPDYEHKTKKHCVVVRAGKVGVATSISKPREFAFPTPEMADAFGKNFKKELEANKELLNDK